jgi:mannose-6-phosphate isomerase-like protein (cupin superfamily)
VDPLEVRKTQRRLVEEGGGYRIVHTSPGLEVGVYVLVAPEPDRQQPHELDEVYVVLEGRGRLEVGDRSADLADGQAIFVPAGADHRFTGYENLSVLVIFAGSSSPTDGLSFEATPGPGYSEGGDIYTPHVGGPAD